MQPQLLGRCLRCCVCPLPLGWAGMQRCGCLHIPSARLSPALSCGQDPALLPVAVPGISSRLGQAGARHRAAVPQGAAGSPPALRAACQQQSVHPILVPARQRNSQQFPGWTSAGAQQGEAEAPALFTTRRGHHVSPGGSGQCGGPVLGVSSSSGAPRVPAEGSPVCLALLRGCVGAHPGLGSSRSHRGKVLIPGFN